MDRRRQLIASLLAFGLSFGLSFAPAKARADALGAPPKERGVALGLFSADRKLEYRSYLEEIKALGATHVLIAYVWWQDDIHASEIRPFGDWSPEEAQIESALKTAKALHLHVTSMPIVRLVKSAPKEWRGRIAPTDEDAWWASYRALVLSAARTAARSGADRLAVGSELVSREAMRERWVDLIERVRVEAPSLELMYSANWDHYREVTFWDRVDVIGLTAYFELTENYDAGTDALARAWQPIKERLGAWSRSIGRPLVLTELGYPSLDGGAVWPWDETRAAKVDLEEQRRAYDAAARAWSNAPFLEGIYFWNWFGDGGPTDTGYTPRGKPASGVIRSWYR